MSTQATNGRAFEWAMGSCLQRQTQFPILQNPFSENARQSFSRVSNELQKRFMQAGEMAVFEILKRERVVPEQCNHGEIIFNSDRAGAAGDVRDVLLNIAGRTLGISCKNNHEAMKHSRLSGTVDFVKKWGLHPDGCGAAYWNAIRPLFSELKTIKKQSNGQALWNDLPEKPIRFYWPILNAWVAEIQRLREIPEVEKALCRALISYLVGKHDFYKVICSSDKTVRLQAWNFNRTLSTPHTQYPTVINVINTMNGGQYSKTIVFNHGYSINFRIHNASSKVEPSLKFDITAIGLPPSEIRQQTLDY